jgi:hypothetical protein
MTKIRFAQTLFAGAATVAALAMFNASSPATPVASGPSSVLGPIATDGDDTPNWVNDNGQTPGDVFTQNAQDQSTASGAGT